MTFKALVPEKVKVLALSDVTVIKGCNGLRVANMTAAVATLAITDIYGNDVTLSFAIGQVHYETIKTKILKSTGSTPISATFIVHGYFDELNDPTVA